MRGEREVEQGVYLEPYSHSMRLYEADWFGVRYPLLWQVIFGHRFELGTLFISYLT